MQADFHGPLYLLASFEFVTSCQKVKLSYMRSNGILFIFSWSVDSEKECECLLPSF